MSRKMWTKCIRLQLMQFFTGEGVVEQLRTSVVVVFGFLQ
jgi:hypothetical protein